MDFFNNKTIMKQITFLFRKKKYVRLLFGRHFAKNINTFSNKLVFF